MEKVFSPLKLRPKMSTGPESNPAKWTGIFMYEVWGLPQNHRAKLWLNDGVWKVWHVVDEVLPSEWMGKFATPEAALESLRPYV